MRMMIIPAMLAALVGCAAAPATPAAQARVLASQPDRPTDMVVPPLVSRPLIGPEGNTYQCTAYPGGGDAGACVQK